MYELKKENEALRNRIKELESELNKDKPSGNAEEAFEKARVLYQGRKRGFATEFNNFIRQPDWRNSVFKLEGAVKDEIAYRKRTAAMDEFLPPWKDMSTWINNKCWEYEFPEATVAPQPCPTNDAVLRRMQDEARDEVGL